MSDDYVKPPRQETGQSDYVAPPKGDSEDYVPPPKQKVTPTDDYVVPPEQEEFGEEDGASFTSPDFSQVFSEARGIAKGYFKTPKVGVKFYLSGYLFIMLYMSNHIVGANEVVLSYYGLKPVMSILLYAYTFLSNYTYCWFADYQRYKGGTFAWFFYRNTSLKSGLAAGSFMNHQTGSVRKTWTGSYQYSSRTSLTDTIVTFLITVVVFEGLKFIVSAPLAFITLFIHPLTIKNYQQAIADNKIN